MILKSFLIEKNVSLLSKYNSSLIYGENIGLKDDIKNEIKIFFKDSEYFNFNQDEIIKNPSLLSEQINNTSLFSKKKIIFVNEVSDKIKVHIEEFVQNPNTDIKIFLIAQTLEKKSLIRKIFEKEKDLGIIACYQDNERTLSEYISKKLTGYTGLTQQIINHIIKNSGLDRKTILNEVNKIKSLFSDKKIQIYRLPELLNNNNNLDFDDVRDTCFNGEKEKLNINLGNVSLQNENSYFYLSVLINRVEKLISLGTELKKDKNIENAFNRIRPPVFWKDKPIFLKQIKIWNEEKLNDAKKMIFETELKVKKNSVSNNSILIKNLVVNLYKKAVSTS
tara:strand:+ start:1586 stop:2590 length:1005 start_codon:yes stop_codon:yes gene_type:complete